MNLRPLRLSDTPAIETWFRDPETTKYMILGRAAPSAQRWVGEQVDGWPKHYVMAMEAVDDDTGQIHVVGVVGLYDIDWLQRKAEFRIIVAPNGRTKGWGTAATTAMLEHGFKGLDLNRIWLGTAKENKAAIRCFKKAGFVEEGRLREDFLGPDGIRWDNIRMGILRREWDVKA